MNPPRFTNDNWHIVCSSPASYVGATVAVFGKVFGQPNQGTDGVALEIMVDWEHFSQHTVVHYLYSGGAQGPIVPRFANDDYVEVKGSLSDPIVSTNLFGAQNSFPCIRANHLVKTTPSSSISDGRTVMLNEEENQHTGKKRYDKQPKEEDNRVTQPARTDGYRGAYKSLCAYRETAVSSPQFQESSW